MTAVVVKRPDELAMRAKTAGVLSDCAIQRLLEEAVRHKAGRGLLRVAEWLHAAGVEPISDEAIVAEVKGACGGRREREAQRRDPSSPTNRS